MCKICLEPNQKCTDLCDSYKPIQCLRLTLMINHINSESRNSLNGCTPFKLSKLLLDNQLHTSLFLQEIEPDDVNLKAELLK